MALGVQATSKVARQGQKIELYQLDMQDPRQLDMLPILYNNLLTTLPIIVV